MGDRFREAKRGRRPPLTRALSAADDAPAESAAGCGASKARVYGAQKEDDQMQTNQGYTHLLRRRSWPGSAEKEVPCGFGASWTDPAVAERVPRAGLTSWRLGFPISVRSNMGRHAFGTPLPGRRRSGPLDLQAGS